MASSLSCALQSKLGIHIVPDTIFLTFFGKEAILLWRVSHYFNALL
jgi:hypothetical protein